MSTHLASQVLTTACGGPPVFQQSRWKHTKVGAPAQASSGHKQPGLSPVARQGEGLPLSSPDAYDLVTPLLPGPT